MTGDYLALPRLNDTLQTYRAPGLGEQFCTVFAL